MGNEAACLSPHTVYDARMNAIRDLIAKHGGTAKVAKKCGKSAQTVSNWITRESIPVRQWQDLVKGGIPMKEIVAASVASCGKKVAAE
jgi:hypothetical protein